MTDENLAKLARLIVANRARIRADYQRKDYLEGAMALALANRKEPFEASGFVFRMVKALPPACESCAATWTPLYPTALELKVEKAKEKARAAA